MHYIIDTKLFTLTRWSNSCYDLYFFKWGFVLQFGKYDISFAFNGAV